MVTVANFDGLIGSTHNYAGLSFGNLASFSNTGLTSNPQAAALQGLEKMKKMVDLGWNHRQILRYYYPKTTFLKLQKPDTN